MDIRHASLCETEYAEADHTLQCEHPMRGIICSTIRTICPVYNIASLPSGAQVRLIVDLTVVRDYNGDSSDKFPFFGEN